MARDMVKGTVDDAPLPSLPLCRRTVDRHGAAVTANAQLAHSGNVAMGSQVVVIKEFPAIAAEKPESPC